jgi:hypothetical protein
LQSEQGKAVGRVEGSEDRKDFGDDQDTNTGHKYNLRRRI